MSEKKTPAEPGWLTRLKAETTELKERLDKLDAFVASPQFEEAAPAQRTFMKSQLTYMTLLHDVLLSRIEHA